MKRFVMYPMIALLLCTISSCENDRINCENIILIDNDKFADYPSDPLNISDVKLDGDCLQITFDASGCSSESWIIELVGVEDVLYSDPPQRSIRLSLKNGEVCAAAFVKTLTFDLRPAQVSGGEIILNLVGWDNPISYKY